MIHFSFSCLLVSCKLAFPFFNLILGSVWFKRWEGRGRKGRGGEIFNYLYVWFKRGEGRGRKRF
jgi:hypothetical protein